MTTLVDLLKKLISYIDGQNEQQNKRTFMYKSVGLLPIYMSDETQSAVHWTVRMDCEGWSAPYKKSFLFIF